MNKVWNFIGVDASLEISLLEYGFICAYNQEDNDWFVVYRINENRFDHGYVSLDYIDGFIKGTEFMDEKDIESFLETIGCDKEDWLQMAIENKLQTLISYHGYENIMGSTYWEGMTEQEVIDRYITKEKVEL